MMLEGAGEVNRQLAPDLPVWRIRLDKQAFLNLVRTPWTPCPGRDSDDDENSGAGGDGGADGWASQSLFQIFQAFYAAKKAGSVG
jgi:hypothetical protein